MTTQGEELEGVELQARNKKKEALPRNRDENVRPLSKTEAVFEFLRADHVRGDYRCYELHILALYGIVITSYSVYTNTSAAIESSSDYSSNWSDCIDVALYIVVCLPAALIYQATCACNVPGSLSIREAYSILVILLVIGFLLYDFFKQKGSGKTATQAILVSGMVAWFIVLVSAIYFVCVPGENLPKVLRHKYHLAHARKKHVRALLREQQQEEETSFSLSKKEQEKGIDTEDQKTKLVQISLNSDLMLIHFDKDTNIITLESKSNNLFDNIDDMFFMLQDATKKETKEESRAPSTLSQIKTTLGFNSKETKYDRYIRRSRPPILMAAVLFALGILALESWIFLTSELRFLGQIANDLQDVAADLRSLSLSELLSDLTFQQRQRRLQESFFLSIDNVLLDSSSILLEAAHKLDEVENDWNNSWLAGCIVSLVAMLIVISTYVPRFDHAVARATKGKLPKSKTTGNIASGTNLFGAVMSIVGLGYILNAIIVSICVFIFINDDIRNFIWDYRVYILSYLIAFVIKSYVLQPYLFHSYATDGKISKRDAAYMLCDIGWTAYGVIVGTMISLLRIVYYILFSCVAVAFLDISLLPSALQSLDSAHTAFFAVVMAHHRHHNSIVHVACDNFREKNDNSGTAGGNKKARARWHLAYTLINNPKLRAHRRSESLVPSQEARLEESPPPKIKKLLSTCKNEGTDDESRDYISLSLEHH